MAAALHLKEVIKMCPSFLLNRSGNSLSSFNGLFSNQFQQNVHVLLTRAKHEDTSSQSKSALQRYKVRNRLPMIKEKYLLTGTPTEKNCASLGCSNKDSCKECKPETSEDFCGKSERPKVKLDSTKEIADKLSSYMVKDGFMRNMENLDLFSETQLVQIFDCSHDDVESIIARHPFLKTTSTPVIEEKVYLLMSYDFPLSMIRNNPRPLVSTYEELNRRLQLFEAKSLLSDNLAKSMEDLYCYLGYDEKKFDTVYEDLCVELDALESCTTNSSKNLAEVFECSQKDVESIIARHPFLKTTSTPVIEEKIYLLVSYDFPLSMIRNNPRPLVFTYEELNRRLQLLEAKSLLSDNLVKSMEDHYSYLAYDEKKFDTVYADLCVELDALESCTTNSSKKLAKLFECSQKDVESILEKHPPLKTLPLPSIEQKVKLLLSYKFPMALIRKNPRPLYKYSDSELTRRLELMKEKS